MRHATILVFLILGAMSFNLLALDSFQNRTEDTKSQNNWHAITYGGSTSTFWESEKDLPSIWNQQGLCRIRVEDDKFVIVFPKEDIHSK